VAWFRPERNKKGREGTQPGFSKLKMKRFFCTHCKENSIYVFPEMNRVTDPGKI
jgi:hypothetical protein